MPESALARAPGKLFIAGEYAVVEPGEAAVLVAVDRYLTVRVSPGPPTAPGPRPRGYLAAALSAVEELRGTWDRPVKQYHVSTASELTRGGKKLGLGSSAAVTVAAVAALNDLYQLDLSATDRFRVAMCATVRISANASGGDVAASTFGGWLRYTSPDRAKILTSLTARGVAATIADEEVWAGCTISPLPDPPLPLLVGWTGTPAHTPTLVAASQEGDTPRAYPEFTGEAGAVTRDLIAAMHSGDGDALLAATRRGRAVLARFAASRSVVVETPRLRALCEAAEAHGGAGKTSGAGGGDCGIAFSPAGARESILEEWRARGITPLALEPHRRKGDEQ